MTRLMSKKAGVRSALDARVAAMIGAGLESPTVSVPSSDLEEHDPRFVGRVSDQIRRKLDEGPELEISRADLYPILAAMAVQPPPLSDDDAAGWHSLASTDSLLLNERKLPFFSRLRDTCRNIGSGELARYEYNGIVGSGTLLLIMKRS